MLTLFLATTIFGRIQTAKFSAISNAEIDESSGLAASRSQPGILWTHNDSGDSPRFFAININGQGTNEYKVTGAEARDWEDIAIDGKTLILGDVGDNANMRPNVKLYLVSEPSAKRPATLKVLRTLTLTYPDRHETKDWLFDCESVAAHNGNIFLITKWRTGRSMMPSAGASLYKVQNPKSEKEQVMVKLDTNTSLGGWVTAADVSPNGKFLALLTNSPKAAIKIFERRKDGKDLSNIYRTIPLSGVRQAESLCWLSNQEILVGNENKDLFKINVH
jgi:hypothetical protein